MIWSLLKVLLFIAAIAGLTYGADMLLHSEEGVRISLAGWEFTLGPLQTAILLLALVPFLNGAGPWLAIGAAVAVYGRFEQLRLLVTVGGAVAMNAGSHGAETCKNIYNIQAFVDSTIQSISADALQYGYRTLRINGKKNDFIVLEATFGLTVGERDGICNCMRHNFFKKKSKQPVTAWSAGCVFKNPTPEMSVGRLLDEAGFKGRQLGGMAFSTLHANFLINEGKGSATAALALLQEARQAVRQRFGIELEPEVRIVPCPLP